jgi:hypothetical protein
MTLLLLSIGVAAIIAVVLHGIATRRTARRGRSLPTSRPPAPRHLRPAGVASTYGTTSDRDEASTPGYLS